MKTSTETKPISAALFWETNKDYTRSPITIVSGAGKLVPGTVLGKITASGKYQPSPNTGSDGSQTAVAILVDSVDATSADAAAMAVVRGPALVDASYLTYHSSVDDGTKKNTKLTQLAAVFVNTVKGA